MTTATIAGVRFHFDEELFEDDGSQFADLDVEVAWRPPESVPGTPVAAPGEQYVWVDVDAGRATLPVTPGSGTASRSWQLRQAAPIIAAAFGRLTLHASAVAFDGTTVAFVGESGVGKSTLAWQLVKDGADPLADDVIAIRWSDDEALIPRGTDLVALSVVAFLDRFDDQMDKRDIPATEALQRHVAHGFGEHGTGDIWATQFDGYSRLARSTRHIALVMPDDRNLLPNVSRWLASTFGGPS